MLILLIFSNSLFICVFIKKMAYATYCCAAVFYRLNDRTYIILWNVINFGVHNTLNSERLPVLARQLCAVSSKM